MSGAEFGSLDLSHWPTWLGVLLAGWIVGLLFYGSLWWTTSKILHSQHPVLWMLSGFVLRMALALSALYWLTDAHWERLLICVGGFLIARPLVIRLSARWETTSPTAPREEGNHASES